MQKSVSLPVIVPSQAFYLCAQDGCNRKYKTSAKLIKHCIMEHQLIVSESPLTPVIVTKENKKSVEREKAANIQRSIFQDQLEAAKRKQQEAGKFSKGDCSICLESIVTIGSVNGCGHGYCFTCISDVMSHGMPCPKCRQPIAGISKLFI